MNHQQRIDDLLDQWEVAFDEGTDLSPEQLCVAAPDLLEVVRGKIAALKSMNAKLNSGAIPSPFQARDSQPLPGRWDAGQDQHEQDPCGVKGASLETTVRTKVFRNVSMTLRQHIFVISVWCCIRSGASPRTPGIFQVWLRCSKVVL